MTLSISFKADLKPLHRAAAAFGAKQMPFAMALAATRLAQGVKVVEQDEIKAFFDRPTPFTQNAMAVKAATKGRPIATVFVKDGTNDKGGQAAYIEPYVLGGDRFLGGKRGMLVPRGAATNQYGNLSKGQLARLKAKPNVFVGKVTFRKSGQTVSGVWQRGATPRGARTKGGGEYGTKGKNTNMVGGVRSTLKLLIQFDDTTPTQKHLPFYESATAYVRKNAAREFSAVLRQALATARK